MDIRSWLIKSPKNKKPTESKKRIIVDDDDDVIPGSPDVQIVNKKKKLNNDTHSSKGKSKPLKEVKATDLFGNGPIKRTEPIVKKPAKKTETGIHSDDEFEKSLLEIDDLNKLESKDVNLNGDEFKSPIKLKSPKKSDIKTEHKKPAENLKNDSSSSKDQKKLSLKKVDENKKETENKTTENLTKERISSKDEHSRSKKVDELKIEIKDKIPEKLKIEPSSSKQHTKHSSSKKVDQIKKEIKDTNKRKFNEFINGDDHESKDKIIESNGNDTDLNKTDVIDLENHDETLNDSTFDNTNTTKKRRLNKSLNESVLTDEERHERKMHSAMLYRSYLNRSGPKHLGTKEMPEGAPNCLQHFAILLTGVLDSFERDEIVETVTKYGGCIKSGISKKVTHVLAGDDAGPAKIAKAQDLGIPILSEDDFLKIIRDSNKPATNRETVKEVKKEKDHSRKSSKDHKRKSSHESEKDRKKSPHNKDKSRVDEKSESKHKRSEPKDSKEKHDSSKSKSKVDECNHVTTKTPQVEVEEIKKTIKSESVSKLSESNISDTNSLKSTKDSSTSSSVDSKICGMMWVEKYKPQNVKQIIGQLGEGSNVNKLINWLTKWYVNRKAKLPKPSPWAKNDDGGYYKAALLSGPPGVGKTTTVSLVCKQLGFDTVEFNASDTRNKTLIKEQIGELLTTTSLSGYAKGETGKQAVTKKHVLVMDEVDGMAGNEDRGGLQELIGLIKTSSVPIICMCNDRNSQKMRTLVNYCYDLRFNRPRVDQIKAAMRSICCKEDIKIPPDVLGQLIVSANQDVRQTLNFLSMWAIDPSRMDPDKLSKDASVTKKDVKLGPWEAIRKVFSAEDHKKMSINDRSDLFFYDYSLAPLFVQENYLQVQPHCPKNEVLQRLSKAADSIAFGDTIDKRIRSSQAWSLLPMQAMYSSVIPGHYLSGHVAGQIQFPGWLGKNSRASKMHRLCQEIHAHTRLSTTGSKSSIFLDYSVHLRDAIITPLLKERADGVDAALQVLEAYHLLREDLDSLVELSVWPGQRNPMVLVDSKVKAAMTRTYNKKATALPYAPAAVKRAKPRDDADTEDYEETGEDDDEPDSDPENDALIKKKKSTEKLSSSNDKPSSSKGKSSKGSSSSSSKGKKK